MGKRLCFSFLAIFLVACFKSIVAQQANNSGNVGVPLLLTPLIEAGQLEEARQQSQVTNLFGNGTQTVPSYSGFFTVNQKFNSNLFFWLFPAKTPQANAPIILWLNGGPGYASLYGLFNENGPYVVDQNFNVSLRNQTWNRQYSVLYIDQPVGAGFSFTGNEKGFATNLGESSKELYEALKQFFALFTEYQSSPFYITGESFAGKYIPGLAHQIHKHSTQSRKAGINLQGIAIGNGLIDPKNQMCYSSHLYNAGLIDERQKKYFERQEDKIKSLIDRKRYLEAYKLWDALLLGELTNGTGSTFGNDTGFTYRYNILYDTAPKEYKYYLGFVNLNQTRAALHVGNQPFDGNSFIVEEHFFADFMVSAAPYLAELLDANYRVLLFSGSLDIIIPTVSSENMLRKLKWKGDKAYRKAPRTIYRAPGDNQITGYVRQVANQLITVTVRNSGHVVLYERPDVGLDLINRFINQQAF